MSICSCGRSPTGLCIGWHNLTNEEYNIQKSLYNNVSIVDQDYKKNLAVTEEEEEAWNNLSKQQK